MPLKGHTFDDSSKTPILIERGKAWTEAYLNSDKGELMKSFSRSLGKVKQEAACSSDPL